MMSETVDPAPDAPQEAVRKRVIQRAGGRHLVFRINQDRHWIVPKPYALISNIEGSIWIFYGVGQLWLTHRKLKRIKGWYVRVPRFVSRRVIEIVDKLENDISEFIDQVRGQELIGTIIIERRRIEFHWTVRAGQRSDEQPQLKRQAVVDLNFNTLATAFAKLQLVGTEGVNDVPAERVKLQRFEE